MTARPLTLAEARARYVHRFTLEHVPAWARVAHDHTELGAVFYAPQYASDAELYALTIFPGEGDLGPRSRYCESGGQTWPLGQGFLTAPYRPGQPAPALAVATAKAPPVISERPEGV